MSFVDFAVILGAAVASFGIGLLSVPAGVIAAGVSMILLGLSWEKEDDAEK